MQRFFSILQILVVIGGLGGVAYYVKTAESAKRDLKEHRAANQANGEIIRILGQGIKHAQARAETFRELNKELAHVVDDNTCRSPAIDGAFDILRRHRSNN